MTWPTSTVAIPRALATRISDAATSRTWLTLPGGAVDRVAGDGLHRVDDEQVRRALLDVAEHGRQVGLGGEQQPRAQRADPLGPQPHLGRRLLAGDVEHGAPVRRRAGGDVEQQGRLADARARRRAATTAPLTRPPPSTRSSSSTPVGPGGRRRDASTSPIGRAGTGGRAGLGDPGRAAAAGLLEACPRPGTRRSGRPTWSTSSRTRRTGRSAGRRAPVFAAALAACLLPAAAAPGPAAVVTSANLDQGADSRLAAAPGAAGPAVSGS